MLISLTTLLATLSSILRARAALELENLALRHQIGVLQRPARKRARNWPAGTACCGSVCPACGATGARRWPSLGQKRSLPGIVPAFVRPGRCGAAQLARPVLSREVRDLIRQMCRENPGWGAPRIHGELLKLGIDIGESSVGKYMLGLARAANDPAGANGESRGASPGRWAASPLRTTGPLETLHSLNIGCRT